MKSVKFKEQNVTLAVNQPEYNQLHIQFNNDVPGMPATAKFEFNDYEMAIFSRTKALYVNQLTFHDLIPLVDQEQTGMAYHPILLSVENPWKQLPIKYERLPFGTIAAWVPLVDDSEREIIGRTFDELVGLICLEFPELQPENLNFVMKNTPDIINNRN